MGYKGGLMIQKQRKSSLIDLRTFLYPLTGTVWLCIFISTLIIAVIKLGATRKVIPTSILEITWESFAANFGGSFEREGNPRFAYKILTFISLMCGNIIWMAYQASLTVDLSSPTTKLPFNNLETFAGTNWNIYTTSKK